MERIDVLLVKKALVRSRTLASKLISEGRVSVGGRIAEKPSEKFSEDAEITVAESEEAKYVSRGALKLIAALDGFEISPLDKKCIDIGASTGGFTQVLLERGAKDVLCVDSGKDQLAPEIANDIRVKSLENTNARNLDENIGIFDIAVMDVSFISQTLIYPAINKILAKNGILISLIKPQFEAGRAYLGKGGIIKDEKAYRLVFDKIEAESKSNGLKLISAIPSPIKGGDGNKEFLALFERAEQ